MDNSIHPWFRDRTFWGVLFLSSIILLPVLVEPLSFDSALNQVMGINLLKYGRTPYIDNFDHSFPGMIYFHAFEVFLFGYSDFCLRLFDFIVQLCFISFFYRFFLQWMKSKTSALTAILYALFYVSAGPGVYGERDVYITMGLLIVISLITVKTEAWRNAVAGILLGFTIVLRPTSLLFLIIAAFFILFDEHMHFRIQNLLISLIVLLLGIFPIAFFLFYYRSRPEVLQTFYDAAFRFNFDVYARLNTPSKPLWEIFRSGFIIIFAIYGIFCYDKKAFRDKLKDGLLYSAFLLSAGFIVVIQGKFFRYHLASFFIFLTPMAAIGIDKIASFIKRELSRHNAIIACLVLCSIIRFNPTSSISTALALLQHRDPLQYTYEINSTDTLFGAKPEMVLRNYFDRIENQTGSIEVCSFNPALRLHLNRLCVGRYPSLHALGAAFRHDSSGRPIFESYQLAWQKAYIDTLRSAKPRFIIVARHMRFWAVSDLNNDLLRYIPGFDSLLSTSYHLDTTFGGYQVYGRKEFSTISAKLPMP